MATRDLCKPGAECSAHLCDPLNERRLGIPRTFTATQRQTIQHAIITLHSTGPSIWHEHNNFSNTEEGDQMEILHGNVTEDEGSCDSLSIQFHDIFSLTQFSDHKCFRQQMICRSDLFIYFGGEGTSSKYI